MVQTRAEVAEALISGYVSDHTGTRMALGRLLQNGMLEEISKIDSFHRLWTWSNGAKVGLVRHHVEPLDWRERQTRPAIERAAVWRSVLRKRSPLA